MSDNGFRPRIVAFLCNWCAYSGADLAGVSRLECSPSVLPVRVMCSGRVDPSFVLGAFARGADGFSIDTSRLRLEWISASEAERYARITNELDETIRDLGPLELKS